MADLKISELNALSGADVAAADLVAVVDASASETKKLSISDLITNGVTVISDSTIPGAKILFGANDIATANLTDGSVTTAKLADTGVTTAKIADNSVTTAKVVDAAVTEAKLAANSVTTAKVNDAAITTDKLAGTSVSTEKVVNSAISTAKLADASVTTAKIADSAVTAAKLGDESTVDLVTTLPAAGAFTGQLAIDTDSDNKLYAWNGGAWIELKSAGSINSVGGSTVGVVNITATTSGDSVTIAATLDDTGSAAQFLAGPTSAGGTVSYRTIAGGDIPAATSSAKGGVIVNGEGLRMDSNTIEIDNDTTASSVNYVVSYNSKGLVTGGRAITAADIPAATSSTRGSVIPGSGLAVAADGTLNHSNSTTTGTFTKLTVDALGHITSGSTLVESDVPDLPATKITSGSFGSTLLSTGAVTAPKLADNSVAKFGGAGATDNIVTFPDADFKGQFFYDEKNEDLYLFNGNSYVPITVISGNLILAGVYNANTNTLASVTTAGSAAGFTASSALPTPSAQNLNYYVVVDVSGTGSGAAPAVALAPPDMLVSLGTGSTFNLIDVSNAIAGQTAANISCTPVGGISATDVQAALQELDTEKVGAASPTFTGTVLLGQNAVLAFEGSGADDHELTITCTNPTADRTITFPNVSGNVVTTGDTGTVTSAMIADGAIVNADINASAEIAVSKLANGTARQILQTDGAGSGVEFASNIDIPGTLDVTSTATFDSTGSFAGLLSANDKLSFAGGSAALPGIYPGSDTNTGIYSPGADQLAFSTNGSSRLEIDSGGNVTVNGQKSVRFADSDSSNYVGLQSAATLASDITFTLPSADGSNGHVLQTNGSGVLSFVAASSGATSLNGLSDAVVKFTTTSTSASIGIGENALNSDDSSENENTAVGIGALEDNTTGGSNCAFGRYTLSSSTTGYSNTAFGSGALANVTTGSSNVAVGAQAMDQNTTTHTGSTAIGHRAARYAASDYVTAVGYEAANNATTSVVCVGHQAGKAATSASGLTAIGYQAGLLTTTGGNNTFVGSQSGQANTTGSSNVAIGLNALKSNTTGHTSTAVGAYALDAQTTGYQNTAIGSSSLTALTTGYLNFAAGTNAASAATTGYGNTSVGHQAAENLTTGSNNTSLGYDAKPSSATSNNEVTLGNAFVSSLRCNQQTISSLSDGRDKTEVENLSLGLEFIDTLRPVKFKWETRDGNGKDGSYEAGFIAQELQSAQSTSNADYLGLVLDDNPDRLEASYGKLIPILVKAIQELRSEVNFLKTKA